MATYVAIRSLGNSLVQFLNLSYQKDKDLAKAHEMTFRLVSSGELADETTDLDGVATLYLYRVTVNDQLRNTRSVKTPDGALPLPLNLHYLLTVWSKSAETEHTVLGWAMRHLHEHSILGASSLNPDAGWAPNEVIHLIPEELSTEEMLRLWDALEPSFRLSCSYVARVVVLESETVVGRTPVVATHFRGPEKPR